MTDLTGQVVVVTGGAAGIGLAISAAFAASGAAVAIVDVDDRAGPAAVAALASAGRRALFVPTDVSAAPAVDRLVSTVLGDFGRIDVLVNNAGIWWRHAFWEITDDEWDRVLAVNLRGTYLCTQRVSRVMAEQGGGCIVNVGSQAGISYSKGQGAHYHASKAAIIHLTKVLAFELGPANIRINCVSPGGTQTPAKEARDQLAGQAARERQARARDQIPLGRLGRPEDVAAACVFLASAEASYITGQNLLVNGGAIAAL
jgi:3-oxoacyl-[acyl-carrier protein] reductase